CFASRRSARRIASWRPTRPAERWWSSTVDRPSVGNSRVHAGSLLAVENGKVRHDEVAMKSSVKSVLAVDVGGSSVKILATGQSERRSFSSGPTLTPGRMVSNVKKLAGDWMYDVVSIGYPGPVACDRPIRSLTTWDGGGSDSILPRPSAVLSRSSTTP